MNKELLETSFNNRISVLQSAKSKTVSDLVTVANLIWSCWKAGFTIFTLGNGGSAAQAEHLTTELMVRFRNDREPVPSVCLSSNSAALTAHGNDFEFETLFSRQVRAFAGEGNIFIGFSTSGKSPNIINAIRECAARKTLFILFVGDKVTDLRENEFLKLVSVPSDNTAQIQEMHLTYIHMICEFLEEEFGF